MAAAAGVSAGWRSAALSQSIDAGASWQAAGSTAAPAILGAAVTVLGTGSTTLIDRVNSVDVQLLSAAMQLNDAADQLLLSGANLAMLGGELLQFGAAKPLGGNVWRLEQLWRGRRGTEDRVGTHTMGEPFTLITQDTLAGLAVPAGVEDLRVTAQGVGDRSPLPEAELTRPGLALRPPSPVALMATRQTNGDTLLSWIRRSRNGWAWVDGVDVPLAEEQEQYAIIVRPAVGSSRNDQTTVQQWTYTAAARAADIANGATSVSFDVAQIGTMQTSLATTLTVSLT